MNQNHAMKLKNNELPLLQCITCLDWSYSCHGHLGFLLNFFLNHIFLHISINTSLCFPMTHFEVTEMKDVRVLHPLILSWIVEMTYDYSMAMFFLK